MLPQQYTYYFPHVANVWLEIAIETSFKQLYPFTKIPLLIYENHAIRSLKTFTNDSTINM